LLEHALGSAPRLGQSVGKQVPFTERTQDRRQGNEEPDGGGVLRRFVQEREGLPGGTAGGPTDPGALLPGISSPLSLSPPPGRAPAASACAPYRELIEVALARGRDAMAIWRDLVDDHGFPAQYASVRRFVLALRGPRPIR